MPVMVGSQLKLPKGGGLIINMVSVPGTGEEMRLLGTIKLH